MAKQKYEDMSIEELKQAIGKIEGKMGYTPRKLETSKDGALLLDPNNPHDREWFDNDEDYNF
ncbi:hypothetical protein [Metasolibacillus sp.]|uniref:hypothetical protein n=1 Tax=Metasolibacillus sp. TaxID=2703680 RepID=UPI0025E1B8F3|nr:hypothetical protein [Metasolibacillus sp.]MCT6922830.1 hypothetical protein [Metasolibacillus sp.]MCT6938831.1 hypothetical protein [Metasolibacillus sp.]